MSAQIAWGIASIVLGLLGHTFYVRGILRGAVKPHFSTWSIWGVLTAVAFAAQYVDGAGPGAWVTGFTALLCFSFAIIGLGRSSRIYITKPDWIVFSLTLLAILIWFISSDPLWSMILIVTIDTLAFIPMYRKAYHHPNTESLSAAGFAAAKFGAALLALDSITVVTVLFPLVNVITNGLFISMMAWRRKTA